MSGPVRIEGVVTEVHRDGSLGVIRGDDGSDYAYSGGHVYRGAKPLTREGQRVEFEYQVGTSWPRMATAIRVLTLIGILEVPISRLISNAIEEVIHGAELEHVNEVGPCPACGTMTVACDTGGTRCLRCAFSYSDVVHASVDALRFMGTLMTAPAVGPVPSSGVKAGSSVRLAVVETARPCSRFQLEGAMKELAADVAAHGVARFVIQEHSQAICRAHSAQGCHVVLDPVTRLSLRVFEQPDRFTFSILFLLPEVH